MEKMLPCAAGGKGIEDNATVLLDSGFGSMDYGDEKSPPPWRLKSFKGVDLHGVSIIKDSGVGIRSVVRSHEQIKSDSIRDLLVCIPLNSRSFVMQSGKHTYCEPGQFRLHSTALPFSATVSGLTSTETYSQITARIPGAMLREDIPDIDMLSNIVLGLRPGVGTIMKSMFELALQEGDFLTPGQAVEFSKTLSRSVIAAITEAPEIELIRGAKRKSTRARMVHLACEFVLENLSNPELDCAMVASHFGISEAYLHSVFAAANLRLGQYIREHRLSRCRLALQNPMLSTRPIQEIAIAWGFENAPSFTRSYKQRFGISPSKDRKPKG